MNPREFLDLAGEWSGGSREGEWRSAASRAYYAAFHVARRVLTRAGFRVPDADRAHGYVWLRFSNTGHSALTEVGAMLRALRGRRNRADYDVDEPFTEELAVNQYNGAVDVVDVLEALEQDAATLAQVTAAMRDYERDVLKEITWRP